jgi:hypothetical protein
MITTIIPRKLINIYVKGVRCLNIWGKIPTSEAKKNIITVWSYTIPLPIDPHLYICLQLKFTNSNLFIN